MKKLMSLALVGALALGTVSPVLAQQDKGKCTKECAKKCDKNGKTDCKKGDQSCCKGHAKA